MAPDVEGLPYPEGSPGAVRSAADDVRGLLGDLRGARSTLALGAQPSGWEGPASTAYTALVSAHTDVIDDAAAELSSAADRLEDMARALDRAQERIEALARRVKQAREAAERATEAEAAASDRLVRAQNAQAAASPLLTSGLGSMGPTAQELVEAQGAYTRASGAATTARATYRRVKGDATAKAQALVEDVEAKDEATGNALRGAFFGGAPGAGPAPGSPSWNPFDVECPLDDPLVGSFMRGLADASARSNVFKQFRDGAPVGPLFDRDVRDFGLNQFGLNPLLDAINRAGGCLPDPPSDPFPPPPPPPPPPKPAPAPGHNPYWPDNWATPEELVEGAGQGIEDGYNAYDDVTDQALEDIDDWLYENLPSFDPNSPSPAPSPWPRPGRP